MKRACWLAAGATPAFWGAYTWGSHLLTLASVWRGPAARRAVSLTFDAQFVDSVQSSVDDALVLGARLGVRF